MILIIDGHGCDLTETFDFKRGVGSEVSLYSYARTGIAVEGTKSLSMIKTACGGNIPEGYCELQKSRIGGTMIKDRWLAPKSAEELAANTVFQQFPADWIDPGVPGLRCRTAPDLSIIYFSLEPGAAGGMRLSDLLPNFPNVPVTLLWLICRGGAGAAPARYKEISTLTAAQYAAAATKAYGSVPVGA